MLHHFTVADKKKEMKMYGEGAKTRKKALLAAAECGRKEKARTMREKIYNQSNDVSKRAWRSEFGLALMTFFLFSPLRSSKNIVWIVCECARK